MRSRGAGVARYTSARRGLTLSWLLLFVFSILLQYGALAGAKPVLAASGLKAGTVQGFEIDGDLTSGDGASNPGTIPAALIDGTLTNGTDWLGTGGVVNPATPPSSVLTHDLISSTSDDGFGGGAKETDTRTWSYTDHKPTPKDDVRDAMAFAKFVGNSAYFYAGATRIVNNGDTVMDFELNRLPFKTYSDGISKPNRSVGDVLISLEFSNGGSDPVITVYKVTAVKDYPTGQDTTYGTDVATAAAVHSATNFGDLPDEGLGYAIPALEFAETSIDLSALGINTGCPGLSNGHIRTRSGGDIDSSQLKDNIQPFPIDLNNCGKIRIEKHAGTTGGALLGGATFTVAGDPTPGSNANLLTVTDNGTGDSNPAVGVIDIDPATPGTYTICETVPPTGYNLAVPPCQQNVVVDPNGSVTVKFADPRKTATTTLAVLTASPSNGSFVTVGQSISLTVTETNTGESALHNVQVSGTGSCASWTPAANKNNGKGAFNGTLLPGESVNFTCTFLAPNAPDFTWSATGTGLDELGDPASAANETVNGGYDILQPATKLTISQDAPPQVHAGDSVTIIVNEKNDGEGDITSVHVDGTGPCAGNWVASSTKVGGGAFSGSLAPGESVNFTCTFSAPANDFSWSADGKGADALGHAVPGTNEHQAGSVDVVSPSTQLTTQSAPTKVEAGATVTVVVRETNTGDGTLTNVHVVAGGDCPSFSPASVASLAPNAHADFTCTFTAASDGTDASWTADGKGTDALGAAAPDTGEHAEGAVIVIAPATQLTIVSPVGTPKIESGDPITITVRETNTGDDTLTGVTVSGAPCATWTPVDGGFNGTLAPSAHEDFTCQITTTAGDPTDKTWNALGHGTDSLQNAAPSAGESQSGNVTVIAPATQLTIVSPVGTPKIESGDSITITVRETNTGDDTLTGVTVSGAPCATWTPVDGGFNGTLAPSAHEDFTCQITTTAGDPTDKTWNALGHGTDSLQNAAPSAGESQSGNVTVIAPATQLTIVSPVGTPKIESGDSITITVRETNTGDDTLTGVTVSGAPCATWTPVDGGFNGTLAPSAHEDFTCQITTTAGDPTDKTWNALGHGTDSLQNAAPSAGESQSGNVTVIAPATQLTIVSPVGTPKIESGDSITITVRETNTGDDTLTGVTVSGAPCATWTPVDGGFNGTLAPSAHEDFTCQITTTAGDPTDKTWNALGHGTDSLQNAAPSAGESQSGNVTVIAPATVLTFISSIPNPVAANGSTTITVRETNTGDSNLTSVNVTGSPCATWTPVDGGFNGTLAPNAHEDFTCTVADVGTTNVNWTALGHGTDELQNAAPATNEDALGSVHVVNPNIDIVKTAGASLGSQAADGTTYETEDGTNVVYKYVVTTQDPDALTNVTVSDDKCSPVAAVTSGAFNVGDTNTNNKLEPGESWVFSCSMILSIADQGTSLVHNIATATGTPLVGKDVSSQDDAYVALLTPAISIVKTAGDAADGAVYTTEAFQDNVTYHYAVKNTGELDLFNVTVVDDNGTAANKADDIAVCTIDSLPVGATATCSVTLTVISDTTNVAVATGHTAQKPNDDVSADDDAVVDVVAPAIDIVKTAGNAADGGTYTTEAFADNVTYHYAVTNTGEVDLFNVTVVDDNGTPADTADDIAVCTIPSLPIKATVNCSVTLTVSQDTTNVAVATGHTEQQPDKDVNASDDAVVNVIGPSIQIVKTAGTAADGAEYVTQPGLVTYHYAVTNTGEVDLVGVHVVDDHGTPADTSDDIAVCTIPSLAIGQTVNCSVTLTVLVSTTNVAVATGHTEQQPDKDVTDDDNAVVRTPSLDIAKSYTGNTGGTAVNGTGIANVGDTLTYTLAYDLSDGPVTNGVITDVLPNGIGYVDGSATNNDEFTFVSYDSGTRTLTWTAASVTKSGAVTYQARALEGSNALPQPLENVATIKSDETAEKSDTADVLVQLVESATDTPNVTLPPTDTLGSDQAPSNAGFGLMLTLLLLAGIGLAAGYLAPMPGRPRRERIRRQ